MGDVELFYLPLSHYCVAAERMLSFKRVPFSTTFVPYHDKQLLLRATRQDYVPCLREGARIVSWKEIPGFLEARWPRPSIYPGPSRGVADALGAWAHGIVEERAWRVALPKIAATIDDPAERWVFEEMQARARGPLEVVALRNDEFRQDLEEPLGDLERMLAHSDWVLGEASRADFAIYGALSPLFRVGEELPDRYPRARRWAQRVRSIPSTAQTASLRRRRPTRTRRSRSKPRPGSARVVPAGPITRDRSRRRVGR